MNNYVSPFDELWSVIANIRGKTTQKSYLSPNDDELEAGLSDASNLFSQYQAKDTADINDHIARKRRGRGS